MSASNETVTDFYKTFEPMYNACEKGDLSTLQRMLPLFKLACDKKDKFCQGLYWSHAFTQACTCRNNGADILFALVRNRLDAADDFGIGDAFREAVLANRGDYISNMLKMGCDPTAQENVAIRHALDWKRTEITELLMQNDKVQAFVASSSNHLIN